MKTTITKIVTLLAITATVSACSGMKQESAQSKKQMTSVVDVAVQVNSPDSPFAGSFDTLIALLTQDVPGRPEILSALQGQGQFTVFAPTDGAFANLEKSLQTMGYCSLADLDPNVVNAVLLYHVSGSRQDSTAVLASNNIEMLSGGSLKQRAAVLTDNLKRNASLIPNALDVKADNGVIHAIDTVVLPVMPKRGPGNCA